MSDAPGSTELEHLLAALDPRLDPVDYVYAQARSHDNVPPTCIAWFREDEGLTLVLPEKEAIDVGLHTHYPCRRIELHVASSLEAIGLMAVVSAALACENISVNVFSAVSHDHLFVPRDRAEDALRSLRALAAHRPPSG